MFGSGLLVTASLLASSLAVHADPAPPVVEEAPARVGRSTDLPLIPVEWSVDDASRPVAPAVHADEPRNDGASGDRLEEGTTGASRRYDFRRDVGAAKWEMAAITGIVILPRIYRRAQGSVPFHFKSEGWFGRDTYALGMDKPLHAWKAYVVTDVIQSVISRRTGDPHSAAITAGIFGMALSTLAEVGDGFSKTTGFGYEDEIAQVAGIGVSMARNMVPGLRDKIDFRLEITPKFNGELSDTRGRAANSRYLLALQLAGFEKLETSPLRFAELHLGYFARGFTDRERLRGDPLRRHVFVGVGFNVQQLFARHPHSTIERLGKGVFDYIQLPHTSINS